MSLALMDGSTLTNFMEDKRAFESCVNECFEMLDVKSHGALTRDELQEGLYKILALSTWKSESCATDTDEKTIYDVIFERFDEDKNGKIDRQEFGALMKEIMCAMARGLGNSSVLVALEIDSLLMKASKHESRKQ